MAVLTTFAYEQFVENAGLGPRLARALAEDADEDMPSASFAGQYSSYLNVARGDVERAVRLCWAPRGSGAEIERQYLGRIVSEVTAEPKPSVRLRVHRGRSAVRALRLQKRLPLEAETFLEAADMVLDLRPDVASASTEALVAYRRRIRGVAHRGVGVEVAVSASAAANFGALEAVLERWLGPGEGSLAAQQLTAGSVRDHTGGG